VTTEMQFKSWHSEEILFTKASRLVLQPTQPPIQHTPAVKHLGCWDGHSLPSLGLRLWWNGTIPLLPHSPSWNVQEQL